MRFSFVVFCSLLIFAGCKKQSAFQALEEEVLNDGTDGPIIVESVTPTTNPVILTSGSTTFAVALRPGAGNVTYDFRLNGTLLETGTRPFTVVNGSTLAAGTHTLAVEMRNSVATASRNFNIRKNSPPVFGTPTTSVTTISCLGGSFTMSATATDADSDALSFQFSLNGAVGAAALNSNSTASSGSTTFTPTCAMTGINVVRMRVTDANGESDELAVNVTVTNPTVPGIISWFPTDNPIVVRSTDAQTFSIVPDGTPPFTTTWAATPGGAVVACPSGSACNISAGTYVGTRVITATMADGSGQTPATRDFNVIFNAAPSPVSGSIVPSNATTIKRNCAESIVFSISIADSNHADTTATNQISWRVNGNTVPGSVLTHLTNTSTHPFTSTATFTPNCQEAYLGPQTISVHFTDGYEPNSVSWDVETSYLSSVCLNLSPGRVCTLAGRGSLLQSSDLSVAANQRWVNIKPTFLEAHPSGGLFISDRMSHMVWFYNMNTSGSITIFGQTVPPQHIIPLVGTGAAGTGTVGQVLTNFYLNEPYGLAWNNSAGVLYISDGANNRVVAVAPDGSVSRVFGGGANSDTDGVAGVDHRCNGPRGIVLHGTSKLYVACNGNQTNGQGHIRYLNLSNSNGYTVARYDGSSNTAGTINGTGTSARVRAVWGLAKHPTKDIVFAVERNICRVLALNSDTNDSFGGVAVNANNMAILTANSCNAAFSDAYDLSDTNSRLSPIDIAPHVVGGALHGLFVSTWDRGSVVYLNFSGGNKTIGGHLVGNNQMRPVFGATGIQGFSRGTPAASNTSFNHSFGVMTSGSFLYVSDHRNGRIARLDTSVSNGAVIDLFQSEPGIGYEGEIDLALNEHRIYAPMALTFNANSRELYFSEAFGGRVRSIRLSNGRLRTKFGNGTYAQASSNAILRFSTPMEAASDLLVLSNGVLLSAEYDNGHGVWGPNVNPYSNGGNGTNRFCGVRALNDTGASLPGPLFAKDLANNFVTTILGSYGPGCQNWAIPNEGLLGTDIAYGFIMGLGATSDGSTLWSSNRDNHCIHELNTTGELRTVIGLCGTLGNSPGTIGTGSTSLIQRPGDIEMDTHPSFSSAGNFFFVDRSFEAGSMIKYANLSSSPVDFEGDGVNDVAAGQVGTFIATTDGFVSSLAYFHDSADNPTRSWLCYSQGANGNGATNAHNVMCTNRSFTSTIRIGNSATASIRAGTPLTQAESENVLRTAVSLNRPYGLTFDDEGNLYIADYGNHAIRMVRKWW